jgi:UPF0755 protein
MRVKWWFLVVLLGLVLTTGFMVKAFRDYWYTPSDSSVTFEVKPGTPAVSVLRTLRPAGHSLHVLALKMGLRHWGAHIRAGEYRFPAGSYPREWLRQMQAGEVLQHDITIVPGSTWDDILRQLQHDSRIVWEGAPTLADIGLEEVYTSPEGWFFPDTYRFTRPQGSTALLARGVAAMKKELAEVWLGRDENLPLKTPYEMLILASIVEKETARSDEKPRVAGVFMNRLRKGMRLQTDPTVIYGMKDRFDGNLRKRDLNRDGPYNTYRRAGLPPTPIACPDRASLLAVAHPVLDGSLYFVADGEGGHWFAKTLEEHNRNVRNYLKRSRQ